jgi:hypothetical protein
MDLNFSTERAQGHFLSPWPKSGTFYFYAKEPRRPLCAHQCGSRKPIACLTEQVQEQKEEVHARPSTGQSHKNINALRATQHSPRIGTSSACYAPEARALG